MAINVAYAPSSVLLGQAANFAGLGDYITRERARQQAMAMQQEQLALQAQSEQNRNNLGYAQLRQQSNQDYFRNALAARQQNMDWVGRQQGLAADLYGRNQQAALGYAGLQQHAADNAMGVQERWAQANLGLAGDIYKQQAGQDFAIEQQSRAFDQAQEMAKLQESLHEQQYAAQLSAQQQSRNSQIDMALDQVNQMESLYRSSGGKAGWNPDQVQQEKMRLTYEKANIHAPQKQSPPSVEQRLGRETFKDENGVIWYDDGGKLKPYEPKAQQQQEQAAQRLRVVASQTAIKQEQQQAAMEGRPFDIRRANAQAEANVAMMQKDGISPEMAEAFAQQQEEMQAKQKAKGQSAEERKTELQYGMEPNQSIDEYQQQVQGQPGFMSRAAGVVGGLARAGTFGAAPAAIANRLIGGGQPAPQQQAPAQQSPQAQQQAAQLGSAMDAAYKAGDQTAIIALGKLQGLLANYPDWRTVPPNVLEEIKQLQKAAGKYLG